MFFQAAGAGGASERRERLPSAQIVDAAQLARGRAATTAIRRGISPPKNCPQTYPLIRTRTHTYTRARSIPSTPEAFPLLLHPSSQLP
jgi:hypothetical protein